jgi:anaerobic C4-dicarboxylate transporter
VLIQRIGWLSRVSVIAVSFLYMLLLLPHTAGITAEHFSSGWFIIAFIIGLAWLPLALLHQRSRSTKSDLIDFLSFAALTLCVAFFAALFTNA